MKEYILSIDQSTSATKAMIFDTNGNLLNRSNIEHKQYYPQPGWVEHDAQEIYENMLKAINSSLDIMGITQNQVKVLSITNQRETVLVWDKNTGKPVHNAIVWQCKRAEDICLQMTRQGYEKIVKEKTGLVLSPYFSAAKVKWILDNVNGAREKAEKGDLLLGTMDSWLVWNLTGGRVHATDYSNASRTQLFNISELNWDSEILNMFTIPESMLPEVRFSDEVFGYTCFEDGFNAKIPISGILGDSHAALFGQNCFSRGMVKTTYGTGSSIMMNIGGERMDSVNGLVTSLAWGMNKKVNYVFEGNINCTGATIKWIVDNLQLISDSKACQAMASSIESTGGVYIVPAFVGLGAPYWDSSAKASVTGITFATKRAHLVRAAEESIAYQIKDVADLMVKESGIDIRELRVDGGPTRDGFLMQFQADILNTEVTTTKIEELSAFGSCLMAGIAVGVWKNQAELESVRGECNTYKPTMDPEKRAVLYNGWKEAVGKTLTR